MSTDLSQTDASTASSMVCQQCGAAGQVSHRFCGLCGGELRSVTPSAAAEMRRRIGGTEWSGPIAASPTSSKPLLDAPAAPTHRSGRRRKRRKKPWFRKPLIVAPLAAMLVIVAAVGVVTYQAQSTISAVHALSAPPSRIADNTTDDGNSIAAPNVPLDFDTAPAQQALLDAGVAPATDDGGVFGKFKDAAGDVTDIASGAAVAAGVKDPSKDAITILVMGVDARPGSPIDIGVRPDALMVLRLNPESGTCRGLTVPRDTLVELPGYGMTKINHALMLGGVPYQKLVMEQFLSIEIDAYALIDFQGFQELVDAVGGIPVTVPEAIDYNGSELFAAGAHTFDGEQALMYARYRGEADRDVGRVRRQQQLIRGFIQVAGGRNLAADMNVLLPAVSDHVRTNLDPDQLIGLADQYRTSCSESALALDTLQGDVYEPGTPDPVYQTPIAYVQVDDAVVKDKVGALLAE